MRLGAHFTTHPRRRHLALAAGVLLALAVNWAAAPVATARRPALTDGQTDPDRTKEYQLKAAFLFNFLKYTTWPKGTFAHEKQPIVLGVVGQDPFGPVLDKVLHQKRVGARAIVIRRFEEVEDVADVHALFLGRLTSKQRGLLYADLAEDPVLTIGDSKGLAGQDSCTASFFLVKGRVRFEVSTRAVARARLTLSSQLLKLADVVEKRR